VARRNWRSASSVNTRPDGDVAEVTVGVASSPNEVMAVFRTWLTTFLGCGTGRTRPLVAGRFAECQTGRSGQRIGPALVPRVSRRCKPLERWRWNCRMRPSPAARSRLSTDQRQQPCTDSVGHSVRGRGQCHCDVCPGVPPPWPGCGQPRAEAIGAVLQPHTYEQHTAPVVVHGHRLSRRQSTIIGARHGTVTASSVARISTGHRGGPRVPSPCR
jgi:hypothetical protein